MRNKIVAGNWKMNLSASEAHLLAQEIYDFVATAHLEPHIQVILAPAFIHLQAASIRPKVNNLHLAAQNCFQRDKGAYTGEVSAAMLASYGVGHCIVGHSERRMYFAEDADVIAAKIDLLLQYSIVPIFCCGEPLDVREANKELLYVKAQIEDSLFHLNEDALQNLVIAYEPIWAIGTGLTATPAQAQDMHKHIRDIIQKKYGKDIANQMSILYGGSCNAQNAAELFACPDIDGGLIGGASLKAKEFITIISAIYE